MSDILEKSLFGISQGSDIFHSDIFQVRWTNLQPSGVAFSQDSVYQKLLKSVHVWRSYSKKQKGGMAVFWGHCTYLQAMCIHRLWSGNYQRLHVPKNKLKFSYQSLLYVCETCSWIFFYYLESRIQIWYNQTWSSSDRRFLKRLDGLHGLSYKCRMDRLGLESLCSRRVKADLLMCYKKLNNHVCVDVDSFFTRSVGYHTRGNCVKLYKTHTASVRDGHVISSQTA